MSGKIKKTSENMSFSLSRWIRRISTNAPSTMALTVAVISYAIFLFGGGLYTLINKPLPAFYDGSKFYFLYPGLSSQFGADTIISVALYAIGFAGVLALYQSAKNAAKPRQAYMLLVVGVALILMAYIFIEGAILAKMG